MSDKDINLQNKTNRLTRDIIENESDIPNNSKTILVQTLIQLYRTGFQETNSVTCGFKTGKCI